MAHVHSSREVVFSCPDFVVDRCANRALKIVPVPYPSNAFRYAPTTMNRSSQKIPAEGGFLRRYLSARSPESSVRAATTSEMVKATSSTKYGLSEGRDERCVVRLAPRVFTWCMSVSLQVEDYSIFIQLGLIAWER